MLVRLPRYGDVPAKGPRVTLGRVAGVPAGSGMTSAARPVDDADTGPRTQGSKPRTPSLAAKKSMPLTLVRLLGFEPVPPGAMFAISTVPGAVPLERHNSRPLTPLSAAKKSVPFTLVLPADNGRGVGGTPIQTV